MAATLPAVVGAALPPPLAILTGVPSGWVSHVTPVSRPDIRLTAGLVRQGERLIGDGDGPARRVDQHLDGIAERPEHTVGGPAADAVAQRAPGEPSAGWRSGGRWPAWP